MRNTLELELEPVCSKLVKLKLDTEILAELELELVCTLVGYCRHCSA